MAAPRQYRKWTYEKYEMSEKRALGEEVKQLKYSLEGKTYWCDKRKKHLQTQPKKAGFVSTAVREFYDNLRKASIYCCN